MQDCVTGTTGSIAKLYAQLGVGKEKRKSSVVHEYGLLGRGVPSQFDARRANPNPLRGVPGEFDLQFEHG